MESTYSPRRTNNLLIILVFLGLLLIGAGGYFLGKPENKTGFAGKKAQFSSQLPSPTPISSSDNFSTYQHPVLEYTLKYPSDWQGGTQEIPQGATMPYADFAVRSPDFKISEGYPLLERGTEISVRAVDTSAKSADEEHDKDPLIKIIGKNLIQTSVDGEPALQCDFSYEGMIATQTLFLKEGIAYTLKYRYADPAAKQANGKIYEQLLASFKTK